MTSVVERGAHVAADPDAARSLPGILLARAAQTPDRVALRSKELGRWREVDYTSLAERSGAIGMGLTALGVSAGDAVAIHAENRPEWVEADLAIQGIGAVAVGIYPTSPSAECEYLLGHSESVVLFAEDEEQVDKALAVRASLPRLRHIVIIDTRGVRDIDADPMLLRYEDLLAMGREHGGVDAWSERVAEVGPDDISIIVYTSGTTGPPKGAQLCQRNLLSAIATYRQLYGVSRHDEVLSYLPLCHIAERLVSVVNALGAGYVVNFGEGGESFNTDLQEVQPTFLLGVPRVWEKMLAGVTLRVEDASRLKRAVYRFWLAQGRKVAQNRWEGRFGAFDRVRYTIGWLVLYRSLRAKLGLGRIRVALSGAAPIAPQVLEYFWSIGVPVREGYGQTENTAQATGMPADDVRLGTVGRAIPGVEIKIADDGEILTRSDGVFVGYLKNPEATAETVDTDGWLHTGDVGTLDDDGFVTITDRKKDIIITAGGKNISPSEIENRLKVSPFVQEAIVIGDRRKYLTALVAIDPEMVGNWCTREGLSFTTFDDLTRKPQVVELVQSVVDEVNTELAQVETIKRFTLLSKELDHEDGEVTATQKVKRAAIARDYADVIEAMY
ncbi:AMP-dependent synthetase/ligase [Actinospongicola halichondriae]|uniref:AMP-dependent synthetase/ligase n=1 Tax=Actinospongicola halichondriae TaxID=3236844 RepID=UPI003D3CED48